MGRWNTTIKTEADELDRIDTKELKRRGFFRNGHREGKIEFEDGLAVKISVNDINNQSSFSFVDINEVIEQRIGIEATRCNFGGERFWFICPNTNERGIYCGKRVRTLYRLNGSFACRHCQDLTYQSKNTTPSFKFYSLYRENKLYNRVEKIKSEIKRWRYADRPTTKVIKYEKTLRIWYFWYEKTLSEIGLSKI